MNESYESYIDELLDQYQKYLNQVQIDITWSEKELNEWNDLIKEKMMNSSKN